MRGELGKHVLDEVFGAGGVVQEVFDEAVESRPITFSEFRNGRRVTRANAFDEIFVAQHDSARDSKPNEESRKIG